MNGLIIRNATEADLPEVEDMVNGFVAGHPAEHQPRPRERLREAYFGPRAVATLVLAARGGRVVGMGQWSRIYDLFWSQFAAEVGWLYVRPEARGQGIPAAIVAEICRQARADGGEHLHGGSDVGEIGQLYERVSVGSPGRGHYVSGEAFQVFAELAGRPPREIVRGLPDPALNHQAPRTR
jgi:GNAT superfamily N-acetyltransferase